MITLGVPTLTRYEELARLITSAENGVMKPDTYRIIDNGEGIPDRVLGDALTKTEIIRPGKNLGVAASWNMLLRTTPEYLIISNDDVELYPDSIERMIIRAETHPEIGFLHGKSNTDDNAWSFFMHRKWLFDQIGPYDEHFWPAYYEDNDMGYRMLLAGIVPERVPDCLYRHVGSATLHAYTPAELEAHHLRFRTNQSHYLNKWGGLPHAERYRLPFGP